MSDLTRTVSLLKARDKSRPEAEAVMQANSCVSDHMTLIQRTLRPLLELLSQSITSGMVLTPEPPIQTEEFCRTWNLPPVFRTWEYRFLTLEQTWGVNMLIPLLSEILCLIDLLEPADHIFIPSWKDGELALNIMVYTLRELESSWIPGLPLADDRVPPNKKIPEVLMLRVLRRFSDIHMAKMSAPLHQQSDRMRWLQERVLLSQADLQRWVIIITRAAALVKILQAYHLDIYRLPPTLEIECSEWRSWNGVIDINTWLLWNADAALDLLGGLTGIANGSHKLTLTGPAHPNYLAWHEAIVGVYSAEHTHASTTRQCEGLPTATPSALVPIKHHDDDGPIKSES